MKEDHLLNVDEQFEPNRSVASSFYLPSEPGSARSRSGGRSEKMSGRAENRYDQMFGNGPSSF